MIRRLHLGGTVRKDGWEVFNALPGDATDHVGDAIDLSRFANGTFEELYGSHILEHFDYTGALQKALKEWRRVLRPGGIMYISVPDLDTLCQLMLDRRLEPAQRFMVMRMLFGGHVDQWDYHQVGLNQEFLTGFLREAGFSRVQRVKEFGIFDDTSPMRFLGIPISLNCVVFN